MKDLTDEMDQLIAKNSIEAAPTSSDANQRKSLRTTDRMKIANDIIANYSMLKKDKGIFHAQLFSAMDDYLKACNGTGFNIIYIGNEQ